MVDRKDPIITYSLVFIGAALPTMHCMQTFLSTDLCYQVDMRYRTPCMIEYLHEKHSESVFKALENTMLRRLP